MGSTRRDRDLHQSCSSAIILDDAKLTQRGLTRLIHTDEALAVTLPLRQEWSIDIHATVLPGSLQQRQITLLHPTIAKQTMKPAQRAPPLGDQQAARGPAIEAVDQI